MSATAPKAKFPPFVKDDDSKNEFLLHEVTLVKESLKDLNDKVAMLTTVVHTKLEKTEAKIDTHLKEHDQGMWSFIGRYKWKALLIIFLLGVAAATFFGVTLDRAVKTYQQALKFAKTGELPAAEAPVQPGGDDQ